MNRRPDWLFIPLGWVLLLALVASAPVSAQDEEKAPQRYRVEVIVIGQPPIGEAYDEAPSDEPPPLPPRFAWPLQDEGDEGLGYTRLPESEQRLNTEARRLREQEDFRVYWHAAWEQPGLERDRAQYVALPSDLGETAPQGMLRVYRSRYLHVEAELRAPAGEASTWVMSGTRRMQSDEQHYLDHPALGLIIRVDEAPASE